MELLDKEQHHRNSSESEYTLIGGVKEHREGSSQFTLIGGSSSKLLRCPSSLMTTSPSHAAKPSCVSTEKCPRCQVRKKKQPRTSTSSFDDGSSRSSSSVGNGGAIMRWDEEDVMAWLRETGLGVYEVSTLHANECMLHCAMGNGFSAVL